MADANQADAGVVVEANVEMMEEPIQKRGKEIWIGVWGLAFAPFCPSNGTSLFSEKYFFYENLSSESNVSAVDLCQIW